MSDRLQNAFVRLEPVTDDTVSLLIEWALDPVARGPYRVFPEPDRATLRKELLASGERQYFLLRRTPDAAALGWLSWRPWRFGSDSKRVDWQLDVLIVEPAIRGFGFELAACQLAADHLLARPAAASVFATIHLDDVPLQRSLRQAGFACLGRCPQSVYPIPAPGIPCVLYARRRREAASGGLPAPVPR